MVECISLSAYREKRAFDEVRQQRLLIEARRAYHPPPSPQESEPQRYVLHSARKFREGETKIIDGHFASPTTDHGELQTEGNE